MEEPPRRSPPPAPNGRPGASYDRGTAERFAGIVTGMTVQNVLVIALLVAVGVPAYFAYVFIHDKDLRHELLSSLEVLDAGVPCLVYVAQQAGQHERYTVGSGYASDGRYERLIAIRATGAMTPEEIKASCDQARADAEILRDALASPGGGK